VFRQTIEGHKQRECTVGLVGELSGNHTSTAGSPGNDGCKLTWGLAGGVFREW
jgi:hypothetical protein